MNKFIILSLIVILGLFKSCKKEVVCTEEFRTIGITVTGDSLTDFYTVRNSNSDTIRFSANNSFPYNHWYQVLDDNYKLIIANSEESFKFIGEINDSIVVNETFIIRADKCHIYKVNGKTEVNL